MILRLPCPAKINLALAVGPPRADAMHPIASWMAAIDFGDDLTLAPAEDGRSTFDLAFTGDAPRPGPIDWPLEKDLAWRAHALLERSAGRALPVRAVLRKRVPTGAGLGGGSSDAGAMLRGLNRLFNLNLPSDRLIEQARSLGSDVAFFAAGFPAALVTGLGERIEPLAPAKLHLVVILPPLSCPTGLVYRAFDEQGVAALDEARVRQLARRQPVASEGLFNDLSSAAMRVRPELASIREQARSLLGEAVHVTGSGSALFALASDAAASEAMAGAVRRDLGVAAVAAETLARSA